MKDFQLALVTGASSGIGEQLCRVLAGAGIPLIIAARSAERLELLAKELRKKVAVTVFPVDLANREQRKHLCKKIFEVVPDLVVNNAGFGAYGKALTHETAVSMDMLEVNASAVLELSLEAARAMVSAHKKGVILNVSSAAAFQIFPCFSVYAATKAFVNIFSESFDEELKPYGIRILTACPGMVATNFQKRASGEKKSPSTQASKMSVEFAADEIWRQIQQEKAVHIFDWKYRLGAFLTRYLVPKRFLVKALKKSIESRYPSRDIFMGEK